ncbi:MAG: helix-hairpin-helix domain-containing protein [Flavobacteriales bacterium]|nr:helix-hairpin-helix domain-containing protein [Flavobacteriales bacterium]
MWKEKIKDWFYFNGEQRRGLTVLAWLMLLVLAAKFSFPFLFKREQVDLSVKQKEIDSWMASIKNDSSSTPHFSSAEFATGNFKAAKLFLFNPNLISTEQWMDLGFSEKQVAAIDKYRSKGGTFRVKSDLKKMFVVSAQKYEELFPFIDLPDSVSYERRNDFAQSDFPKTDWSKNKTSLLIDLNLADTSDLKKLRGIGPYFAKSIVKFRDDLGGFHSIEQLNEVYNMKPETLDSIRPNILLGNYPLRKLNINTATFDELNAHPYISNSQAKTIIAYRENHGLFLSIDGLKKVVVVDDETFRKVQPYLAID